jgi:hypothetical protein
MGVSVDHVILDYQPKWADSCVPADVRERQRITLALAGMFLRRHSDRRLTFTPVGVAQGWSPESYASAVNELQSIGYRYIALGGLVPLKTSAILDVLQCVQRQLRECTKLHLLGVTRVEQASTFASFGVVSFDTTSPLRQAFKDQTQNYYWGSAGAYTAIRIPQLQGNPTLMRKIRAGQIHQEEAARLEQACLSGMKAFSTGQMGVAPLVSLLAEYETLYDGCSEHAEYYRRTLEDRPWTRCRCDVCQAIGYHVILFRGAERNRRRGFHNLWTFRSRLRESLSQASKLFDEAAYAAVAVQER